MERPRIRNSVRVYELMEHITGDCNRNIEQCHWLTWPFQCRRINDGYEEQSEASDWLSAFSNTNYKGSSPPQALNPFKSQLSHLCQKHVEISLKLYQK